MIIRMANESDRAAVWGLLEPVVRAGECFALPRDMSECDAVAYWLDPTHRVFVAVDGEQVVGSYFIQANQRGGGAHVANCGYISARAQQGRGVAHAMCEHSLAEARSAGFRAVQFNFVVSTNHRAVALWQRCGFAVVGRLPGAFEHPHLGEASRRRDHDRSQTSAE
jgi:ribosomal protein S18 acetylase RimI-like enzyme